MFRFLKKVLDNLPQKGYTLFGFRNRNILKGRDILEFDYSKLRGRIKEVCGTQCQFAEAIGMGRVSLSMRLCNRLEFTQEEMRKACAVLKIQPDRMPEYFFVEKVSKTKQKGND